MYDLPYHKENDPQILAQFISRYPFAFLSGCDAGGNTVATQVPVFYETRNGQGFLSGHLMRNTDHHKAFLANDRVLAVFSGPHAYVSATWYSNPFTASTWNYMSVHAQGRIRFLDNEALVEMLRKTTLHFEDGNRQSSTIYDNLPPDFLRRVMPAIAAFEIAVTKLDSVFKLSQDRDRQSYRNIIGKLEQQGENGREIAAEMVKREGQVFPE